MGISGGADSDPGQQAAELCVKVDTPGVHPGKPAGVMGVAEEKPTARARLLEACLDTDM